jgi:hypothetical protein
MKYKKRRLNGSTAHARPGYNATQIACAAHARGARVLATHFGTESFNTSRLVIAVRP